MDQRRAEDPQLLSHYEGLVRKSAARYDGLVLHDFDDICQIFRVKVWKALLAWNPKDPRILKKIAKAVKEEGRDPKVVEEELRDRFVFMCLRNQGKDLVKRRDPEKDPLFIEDLAQQTEKSVNGNGREGDRRDRFDAKYLSVEDEEVFGWLKAKDFPIEDLTRDERRVLVYMYLDYTQAETALRLGLPGKKVSAAVKSIRTKLADLAPTQPEPSLVAA